MTARLTDPPAVDPLHQPRSVRNDATTSEPTNVGRASRSRDAAHANSHAAAVDRPLT
jgi:hypothetical protein